MTISFREQFTDLETSKRLKELGVVQESCFAHIRNVSGWHLCNNTEGNRKFYTGNIAHNHIAAFSGTELGAMLPQPFMQTFKRPYGGADYMEPAITILRGFNGRSAPTISAITEVKARAKMLIWLLENHYISANGITKRLRKVG